jgi:hypothetical protein
VDLFTYLYVKGRQVIISGMDVVVCRMADKRTLDPSTVGHGRGRDGHALMLDG